MICKDEAKSQIHSLGRQLCLTKGHIQSQSQYTSGLSDDEATNKMFSVHMRTSQGRLPMFRCQAPVAGVLAQRGVFTCGVGSLRLGKLCREVATLSWRGGLGCHP